MNNKRWIRGGINLAAHRFPRKPKEVQYLDSGNSNYEFIRDVLRETFASNGYTRVAKGTKDEVSFTIVPLNYGIKVLIDQLLILKCAE